MKILTKENANEMLSRKPLDAFITQLSSQLQLVDGSYTAPVNSGVQLALSKLFAYLVFRDSPVCWYVTCWGIATEHLDLFDGYWRSFGEKRPPIQQLARGSVMPIATAPEWAPYVVAAAAF